MRGDARALGPCDPHANLGVSAEVDANCVTLSTASHCPSTNRAALRPAPQAWGVASQNPRLVSDRPQRWAPSS